MPQFFKIIRTRLLTETYRVTADNEDQAVDALLDLSSDVEQLTQETHTSTIDLCESEGEF